MQAERVAEQDDWDLEWVSTIQRIVAGNNSHISSLIVECNVMERSILWLSYVGEVQLNQLERHMI